MKKLTKTLCVTAIAGAVAIPFTAAQAWGPWSNGWGHDGYGYGGYPGCGGPGYGGYPGAYGAPYGYAPPAATPAQPAASGAGQ